MQIRLGRTYRCYNGILVKIIQAITPATGEPSPEFPFIGQERDEKFNRTFHYTPNGHIRTDGARCGADLIEEVQPPETVFKFPFDLSRPVWVRRHNQQHTTAASQVNIVCLQTGTVWTAWWGQVTAKQRTKEGDWEFSEDGCKTWKPFH